MNNFSHVYLVGCSYMNSFAATKPLTKLSEYFGGKLVDLSKAGSGFDYQERILYTQIINDKPKNALVIWGLSYWHRFELAYRDIKDRNNINFMQFNPSSIIENDMADSFGVYHKDIKNLPENLFTHRVYTTNPYIEKHLRDLNYITSWLKNNGHEYIIFNYADNGYKKYLNQNQLYAEIFSNDNGFVKLSSFLMNEWLYNYVEPDPNDLKIVSKIYCHPVVNDNLKNVMTEWIINYYKNNLLES